jgi:thioredoxin-dependent peroxiredoxin
VHEAGLRDPRRVERVRAARRGRARGQPDDERSHAKFKEKYGLPFTLLADPGHKLTEELGFWVEKSFAGKKYMGVERSTVVIDPDGKVRKVFRKVKPAEHAEQVLEALR